jgi:hypothetical protein
MPLRVALAALLGDASIAVGAEDEEAIQALQDAEPSVPLSLRVVSLVARAHFRGLLSEGQVTEILGVDRLRAREIVDGFATDEERAPI